MKYIIIFGIFLLSCDIVAEEKNACDLGGTILKKLESLPNKNKSEYDSKRSDFKENAAECEQKSQFYGAIIWEAYADFNEKMIENGFSSWGAVAMSLEHVAELTKPEDKARVTNKLVYAKLNVQQTDSVVGAARFAESFLSDKNARRNSKHEKDMADKLFLAARESLQQRNICSADLAAAVSKNMYDAAELPVPAELYDIREGAEMLLSEKDSVNSFDYLCKFEAQSARGAKGVGIVPALRTHIRFGHNSSQLSRKGRNDVAALAKALREEPYADQTISLVGHADYMGQDSHNLKLSYQRAVSVKIALGSFVDVFDRVKLIAGCGEYEPYARKKENHALNRRVSLMLTMKAEARNPTCNGHKSYGPADF